MSTSIINGRKKFKSLAKKEEQSIIEAREILVLNKKASLKKVVSNKITENIRNLENLIV